MVERWVISMRFAAFFTTYQLERAQPGPSKFEQSHEQDREAIAKEREERREAA